MSPEHETLPTPHLQAAPLECEALYSYYNRIKTIEPLRAEEEVSLALTIAAGRQAAERLETQPPSFADLQLVEQAQAARAKFIESNLRLVVSVTRHYYPPQGLERLDLIQEGNQGLATAVDRFNPHLGIKFSTFACIWIRKYVLEAIAVNQGPVTSIPKHIGEQFMKERKEATAEQRSPSPKHLKLRQLLQPAYIDEERGAPTDSHKAGRTIGAALEDKSDLFEEIIDELDRKKLVEQLLGYLKDVAHGQEVITALYGLDGRPAETFEQIAKRLGIGAKRVSNIAVRCRALMREQTSEEYDKAV